ncbi:MAG: hypothetical protein ACOYJG_11240 [Prevotella sp.]
MWKHKQLPLVMTTTGYAYTNANLDSFVAGSDTLFQVHSNLLFETTDDEPMLAMCSSFEKGETYPHKVPAYMNIYLPHGYSFTGYRIEVDNYINESNVPTELWNSIGKYVHKSDYVYFGRIPAFKSESDADNNFNDYTQYVTLDNTSANSTTQVLESKASDSEGWGNVLFFRLMIDKSQFTQSNTAAATIRIKSIELWFTTETDNVKVTISPSAESTTGVSYVESEFDTGKEDVGAITIADGDTRMRYDYDSNFGTYKANVMLYEDGVVSDNTLNTSNGSKTITSISTPYDGYYYHINSTGYGQRYYLEVPDQASYTRTSSTSTETTTSTVPVYYRFTNGKINYRYPFAIRVFGNMYINNTVNTANYVKDNNGTTTENTPQYIWEMDEEGRIYTENSNSNRMYLGVGSPGNNLQVYSDKADGGLFSFKVLTDGSYVLYYNPPTNPSSSIWSSSGYVRKSTSLLGHTYGIADYEDGFTFAYVEIENIGDYSKLAGKQMKIYSTTANTESASSVEPSMTAPIDSLCGTIDLSTLNLNNDAIEFQTEVPTNLSFDMYLQPLNPYVNSVEIECQDSESSTLIARQSYEANNFSFGDEDIYFYVPSTMTGKTFKFYAKNLYSEKGDDSYDNGTTGHSRYYFVQSTHYTNNSGSTDEHIYTDPSVELKDEASDKISVSKAGTEQYRFNNADSIAALTSGTAYYQEYKFYESIYTSTTTAGTMSGTAGDFADFTIIAPSDNTATSKTLYLFVADNPKYLIAPYWTGKNHRAVAYYATTIHLQAKDITPTIAYTKIYDDAYYGSKQTGDFYGATVSVEDADETTTTNVCSIESISSQIATDITNNAAEGMTDKSQLLYVDMGSNLYGVYADEEDVSWESFRNELAENALIFLPVGSSSGVDNVVSRISSADNTYLSANDIVLTDKYPFYSPFNIEVDADHAAKYVRAKNSNNSTIYHDGTLILPFSVALTNGTSGDTDNGTLTWDKIQESDFMTEVKADDDEIGTTYTGKFTTLTDAKTTANTPYHITISGNDDFTDKIFAVEEKNATIVATPANDAAPIDGATSSSTIDNSTYTFTMQGTFKGVKIADVYYFSDDKYYSAANLSDGLAKMYPFRAFIQADASTAAKISSFRVVFGDDETTGIDPVVAKEADLAVIPGKGMMRILAKRAQEVRIYSLSGALVNTVSMEAGATKDVYVGSGVYIVNGHKIIVK